MDLRWLLKERGLLRLSGQDRKNFLQGLITNDITLLSLQNVLYAALLSPQGKFLHDFFLIEEENSILMETSHNSLERLKKRLTLYKLDSNITLENVSSDYEIFSLPFFHQHPTDIMEREEDSIRFIDPRLSELGARLIEKSSPNSSYISKENGDNAYNLFRLKLGIPEAEKDMISDQSIPLEAGLQDLNAISWTKGCYLGQELTARTHYRGVIRKRLFPVEMASSNFDAHEPIVDDEGIKVGTLSSFQDLWGIARLRIEALNKSLFIGKVALKPFIPSWVKNI